MMIAMEGAEIGFFQLLAQTPDKFLRFYSMPFNIICMLELEYNVYPL
jgi:hypothetical protein